MKIKLLLSTFFCFVSAMAMQAANRELVLVDAKGKVVSDNATLSFNKVEKTPFGSEIKASLSVRNASGKDQNIMLSVEIVEISGSGAALQVCFPVNCNRWDAKGTHKTGVRTLGANEKDLSIETELVLTGKARCTAVLKFYSTKSSPKEATAKPDRLLTTATLKFNSDATGIESVKNVASETINEVWNVQGTFVGRNITDLNSLPKGLYLVRQNGKTTKVVVGK